jgi:hypothetical protein
MVEILSAEDGLATCDEILQHMLDNRWAQTFNTNEELHDYLSAAEIILNKFALITKTKPDGTT